MSNKELIDRLKERFEEHMERHSEIEWTAVQKKLEVQPEKLASLLLMEQTGGEPDVIGYAEDPDSYLFFDFSKESPKGRRSLCYDEKALASRKKNKPSGSAMGMADQMGVEMLDSQDYQRLQNLGQFDLSTSSWVRTPQEMRILGGALFCDKRYGRVFTYHNGAESYYESRGFRAKLRV